MQGTLRTCVGDAIARRPRRAMRRVGNPPRRRHCTWVHATAAGEKTAKRIVQDYHTYTLPLYVRPDPVLVSGKGAQVMDSEGKWYLDFSGGIAVNALGHADERIRDAIEKQAGRLMHVSNLFHTEPAVELAKRLAENSFAEKVFLCNSGTEANEAAIKFARKWAAVQNNVDPYDPETVRPYEIVSFTSGFHGRTMGALAITPKQKYQTPFLPMMPGHRLATFNDLESAEAVVKAGKTCAVFVEPVQGEGGVRVATTEFLQGLRRLCDACGCLLIFDEVQCGFGRSGQLWAHSLYNVTPDVMTLAKPLAGGLPIGAVLMTDKVAEVMKPGDHASTFAGNPLVCNVANTVFDIVSDASFLEQIRERSIYMEHKLSEALATHPHVQEIRHCGLLFGIQCDFLVGDIVARALDAGLLVITAGQGDVIRLAPPLNITFEEIDECAEKLKTAFNAVA